MTPARRCWCMPPSVGGVKEVTDYFAAVRLRHQPAGLGDQRDGGAVAVGDLATQILDFLAAPFVAEPHPDRDPRLSGRARRRARGHLRRPLARADCRARRDHRDPAAGLGRRSPRALGLLGQPRVHVHRRGDLLDDSGEAVADPAGSDHRHHLCRGVGGGHPGDEQVHLRSRASQAHAGRQHHRGLLGRGRQDGRALRRRRHVPLRLPASSSSRSR